MKRTPQCSRTIVISATLSTSLFSEFHTLTNSAQTGPTTGCMSLYSARRRSRVDRQATSRSLALRPLGKGIGQSLLQHLRTVHPDLDHVTIDQVQLQIAT